MAPISQSEVLLVSWWTVSNINTSWVSEERQRQIVVADRVFGSIPGLEFSLSIPSMVVSRRFVECSSSSPVYVWLNQRCQWPCPNAALQAWLPVLPKNNPFYWRKRKKLFFLLCDFSTVFLSNRVFQWIFIDSASEAICGIKMAKWLQIVTCFVSIIINIIIIAMFSKMKIPWCAS